MPGVGMHLDDEYPVPSTSELIERWQAYQPEREVVEAPGVYGVVSIPEEPPETFISLDLCEVLRETHKSLVRVEDTELVRMPNSIHRYGDGLSIANDILPIARVLMSNNLVSPVSDIEDIKDIIHEWRRNGAYVFANTSTLPGCELGTIDFFDKHLKGCFDGILLPRNHDGTLPATKGVVARDLVHKFHDEQTPTIRAIHIDDTPHHNVSFRQEVASFLGSRGVVATFSPAYESHLPADDGSIMAPSPLATFVAARNFLINAA